MFKEVLLEAALFDPALSAKSINYQDSTQSSFYIRSQKKKQGQCTDKLPDIKSTANLSSSIRNVEKVKDCQRQGGGSFNILIWATNQPYLAI